MIASWKFQADWRRARDAADRHELHVSAKTVESYQAHIKEKLALRNARELVQHAVEWSLAKGA